jgi:hypothetical protein
MLVERINRYLNKGLKIMTSERDSIRVALEAILLLIYTWNSCPVSGTDISRSLVAVGREFQFPIDFSSGKAAALISAPGSVESYSRLLAERLSACHEVALLLVRKQRCWHRKLVNHDVAILGHTTLATMSSPAELPVWIQNMASLTK